MRTPRQELHLEIARVERAFHDALETLERCSVGPPDSAATRPLVDRCRQLAAQLDGAVRLLGPGENEDAIRTAAQVMAGKLAELVRRIERKR